MNILDVRRKWFVRVVQLHPNTSRLEAVYVHSLIIYLSLVMYLEIHPFTDVSIKLKSIHPRYLMRECLKNENEKCGNIYKASAELGLRGNNFNSCVLWFWRCVPSVCYIKVTRGRSWLGGWWRGSGNKVEKSGMQRNRNEYC